MTRSRIAAVMPGEQRFYPFAQPEQVSHPLVDLLEMGAQNPAIAAFAARTAARLERLEQRANFVQAKFEHAGVMDELEPSDIGRVEQAIAAGAGQAVVTPGRRNQPDALVVADRPDAHAGFARSLADAHCHRENPLLPFIAGCVTHSIRRGGRNISSAATAGFFAGIDLASALFAFAYLGLILAAGELAVALRALIGVFLCLGSCFICHDVPPDR